MGKEVFTQLRVRTYRNGSMKIPSSRPSEAGNTLLIALIGAVVAGGVMLSVTQLMKSGFKSSRHIEIKDERSSIRRTILDNLDCKQTLNPAGTPPVPTTCALKNKRGEAMTKIGEWTLDATCTSAGLQITAAQSLGNGQFKKDPLTQMDLNGPLFPENGYPCQEFYGGGAPSPTGLGGSGTGSYVAKWTSATELGNSVMYENAGKLGVGTTSPTDAIHVNNATMRVTGDSGVRFFLTPPASTHYRWRMSAQQDVDGGFGIGASTTPGTETYSDKLIVHANGNVEAKGSLQTGAGQNFKIRYGRFKGGFTTLPAYAPKVSAHILTPIPFGYTFSSPPVVTVTLTTHPDANSGYAQECCVPYTERITPTEFAMGCKSHCEKVSSGTIEFDWIAIGE
jgi:hypothetical protein